MSAGDDLASVATARLLDLHRAIISGRMPLPVSSIALRLNGFGDLVRQAPLLARAGSAAALLIETVVADRAQRRGATVELVWSGPAPSTNDALDTRAVVQRMFANAEEHVMVCGFAFYQASDIFAALYQRAKQRHLDIDFFVHFSSDGMKSQDAFWKHTWPWRDVVPDVYYDPRTLDGDTTMHAKVVVVDGRSAFVTSANFTAAAHSSNTEIGALIEDPRFAQGLTAQWHKLKAMAILVASRP